MIPGQIFDPHPQKIYHRYRNLTFDINSILQHQINNCTSGLHRYLFLFGLERWAPEYQMERNKTECEKFIFLNKSSNVNILLVLERRTHVRGTVRMAVELNGRRNAKIETERFHLILWWAPLQKMT